MYIIMKISMFLTSLMTTYSVEKMLMIGLWNRVSVRAISMAMASPSDNIFRTVLLISLNLFAPAKCPVTILKLFNIP